MADAIQISDEPIVKHRHALRQLADVVTPAWIRALVEPDDLVQDTLLEALENRGRFENMSDSELLAYLRRALSNNLIDRARRFTRHRNDVSPDAVADSSVRMANWLAADHSSPSERAQRNERFASLAIGVRQLPEDQRMAIQMRYLLGQTVRDIAIVLERSEGAVSALLHRAVLALRENLKDGESFES